MYPAEFGAGVVWHLRSRGENGAVLSCTGDFPATECRLKSCYIYFFHLHHGIQDPVSGGAVI
jgi:hypothetical protein